MINRFFLAFLAFLTLTGPAAQAQERAVPESNTQIQLSFAPVVKQVSPAVVNIYTKRTVSRRVASPFMSDPFFAPFFGGDVFGGRIRRQLESSLGSGLIIEADGLVVTNAHVVKGAEEITVVLSDGREFDATLALSDAASDLALLRMDADGEALPYARLKGSESLEVGDLVLAIGNPFGVGQTVTSGIVSAQGRSSLNINDFNFFIQTDAAINPGNSGGPLVTLDGQVVGINTAIYSRDGGSLGIGFAIPSEMVATIVAAEKNGRMGEEGVERPWLGVTAQTVTSDIAESLGLGRPAGVLIAKLHSASPLKEAGLNVGDVVLRMDGRVIRNPSEMKFRMATVPMGGHIEVVVTRKGKEHTFKVKAMAAPEIPPRNQKTIQGHSLFHGVSVSNINPAVMTDLSIDEESGVVIADIERGSPAARFLRIGEVLLEINGQTVETTDDVARIIKTPSQGVSVSLSHNGRIRTVSVR
jgi:serine protease Do